MIKTETYHYENVELLVTHFNRSSSLERLLESFKQLSTSFGNIVVSDDGSRIEHLAELKKLQIKYEFNLIMARNNKGLGNNINKGQDEVVKPYTLYVQEDFVPEPEFNDNFPRALEIMETDESVDLIRFYAYFKYPYLKEYGPKFSEMVFSNSLLKPDHLKFYVYSDHPHLRRSNFFEKFDRYKEDLKGDVTEFDMCLSFIKKGGKGLFIKDFKAMFEQVNSSSEPSTMERSDWKNQKNAFVKVLRAVYLKFRLVKNTIQLIRYKD
jgi:glycosyltransferase involved in cell wall biosynthesis